MSFKVYEFVILNLIFSHALYVTCYHSDIPTFQVGPLVSGNNSPHCPCEDVNSTFYRSCGVMPKVSGVKLPVNGAHFGEFPWQVAIIEKYEEEFLCSGVLVSPKVVLTAGRCIQEIPTSHIRVRLGDWDILSEDKNPLETYGSLEMAVSKKYLNPDLITMPDVPNEIFNLGILKLTRSVNFDEYPHISPICLPAIMNHKANLSHCMVTGWSSSAVKPLNEFMDMYVDDVITTTKGIHSELVKSTCTNDMSENDCHIHSGNIQEITTESTPLEMMLKEVDGITAKIRGKLEGNTDNSEKMSNSEDNYAGKDEVFSRILWKSNVKVLSRSECGKLMKDLNVTAPKPAQICITEHEDSKPCLGDIGSPVICKISKDKRQNWKENKTPEDKVSKFAVIGVITQSYSCSTNDKAGLIKYPILATSISKSLDHICHVMASSSKDSKAQFFKVVH